MGVFIVPYFISEKGLKFTGKSHHLYYSWEGTSLVMGKYRVIKKSVHLTITIQKVTSNVQSVPHQGQGDTRLTLMPSVIPNSNYIIMVGDWNCLNYCIFACFLYCNRQVHRDFLITLYISVYSSVDFCKNKVIPFLIKIWFVESFLIKMTHAEELFSPLLPNHCRLSSCKMHGCGSM